MVYPAVELLALAVLAGSSVVEMFAAGTYGLDPYDHALPVVGWETAAVADETSQAETVWVEQMLPVEDEMQLLPPLCQQPLFQQLRP